VKAIIVTERAAGIAGMRLVDRADPDVARLESLDGADYGDVVVEVRASGFTGNELDWPSTWVDRQGRDRTPTIPGHEVAGVVTALSYGAAGLTVGQRVFGLTDWTRDGSLAEYAVVEARNLAPLPGDVDFVTGAGVAMTGLTAWQGLFEHGRLEAGQAVLVHGAAGAVGSMAAQLAREAGAHVIGTGRAAHRLAALDFGAHEFVDLENDELAEVGGVDLVFDVFGGELGRRSARLVRPGGTFVTVAGRPDARPAEGRSVDFVVVSDRRQLTEIAQRVRSGRLRPHIGRIAELADAASALDPATRAAGKTVIRIRP
jgi:NADPH:quinone reductase-like Zn-dependent oxidoreductase